MQYIRIINVLIFCTKKIKISSYQFTLSTSNLLVTATMKNAAKCENVV